MKETDRKVIDLLAKLGANFHFKKGQRVRLVTKNFLHNLDGEIGMVQAVPCLSTIIYIVRVKGANYPFYAKELRPLSLSDI